MKKVKIVLFVLIVLVMMCFGFFRMTGFYINTPVQGKSAGETVWFYRRLIDAPFLFSADSITLKNGTTPGPVIRAAVNANVQEIIGKHVLHRFKYRKSLYLKTTGNRDFLDVKPE